MGWYKIAKDFDKRNTINAKIRYLTDVKAQLMFLGKFVFQSGKNAKEANYRIITSDKITSYPSLHEILITADTLALDSPWKFASLCGEGVSKINTIVAGLKEEREEFIHGDGKKRPMKGWVD